MNFVLGLSCIQNGLDFIFIIVDRFSKIKNFIPCKKIYDAFAIPQLFF